MTLKTDKRSAWFDPNEDKFSFAEHARELDAQNQFAQPDTPPGIGLRQFLSRETRAQAASTGSSEVLVQGKIFLKQIRDGTWELIVYRGRCTYDVYPGETREELVEFAETLLERK
jgi:hypothetical protein